MKIGRITKVEDDGKEQQKIELSGWMVFKGLLSAGLISGVVSFFTFILVDLPKNEQELERSLKLDKFEIVNFVLRSPDELTRKNSLIFLIETDVISDDGSIQELIENNAIPDWSQMPEFKKINE